VSNEQEGGIQCEFEAEQCRERIDGETGLDMAGAQINNSANLFSLGDGQRSKIGIVGEDDAVVGPRVVQQSAIAGSGQSRFFDIEYLAALVAQELDHGGVNVFIGQERKLAKPQLGTSTSRSASFFKNRAA